MPQWKRNLYFLWVGTFIAGMSFSLVSPFLPMLLQNLGVDEGLNAWSGIVYSASFIMSAIMSPIWGSFADKYGRKIMIIRSGFGMALCYIGLAFAVTPWQVLGFRLANGLVSGFIPSATALAATSTPDENLGSSLGMLQTGSAFGTIMGPLFGGVMSHYLGIKSALLLAAAILAVGTLIVIVGVKEQRSPEAAKMKPNILNDLRIARTNQLLMSMLFTVLLFRAATMIIQPVLPIFIGQILGDQDASLATGFIFSLVGFATVIAAPFWGSWGQRSGFKRVLLFGLLGAGLLSIPHAFTNNLWVLGSLRFTFGIFMASLMPASNALIARSVPNDFRGRAFGISNSFGQMGAFIGPMLGGFIGEVWNIQGVFIVTALTLLATAYWVKGKEIEVRPAVIQQEARSIGH